jgi:hypothetical protein
MKRTQLLGMCLTAMLLTGAVTASAQTANVYQKSGYKGFVEAGYTVGIDDNNFGRVEVSTSHGYQFNPYFFLGVGLALSYYTEPEKSAMPIFADARVNFLKGKFVPFAGVKIGYTTSDAVKGFYFAPSVGVKMMLSRHSALNFSLGYVYQAADYITLSGVDIYTPLGTINEHDIKREKENIGGVSFRVGFEF